MSETRLMMVAGERSGDVYGARLAAALKDRLPEAEIFGCGGEAMRGAGVRTVADVHDFAMVGITEVVSGLPRARRAFHRLLDEASRERPQVAILIDSPSLNIRVARELKRRGVTVVYFVSPQIWAWKRWRLQQLKQRIDKMLCIFDFEEPIYRRAGIPVEYVGHPLVGTVRAELPREAFFARAGLDPATPTVALLPGSRRIEVAFNLPRMLEASQRLGRARPVQFVLAIAPTIDPDWLERKLIRGHADRSAVRAVSALTHDALAHSDVAVVASGTATVEAALLECPMVVVYRVARVTALFARFMVNVPFYSMVNLLAGKPVVRELIQGKFTSEKLAGEVAYLLDHPEACEAMRKELKALKSHLGAGRAIERAADAVVRTLTLSGAGVRVG
jgi:lipid-A-disaccharide synthase